MKLHLARIEASSRPVPWKRTIKAAFSRYGTAYAALQHLLLTRPLTYLIVQCNMEVVDTDHKAIQGEASHGIEGRNRVGKGFQAGS
jgi:hypothetical protein